MSVSRLALLLTAQLLLPSAILANDAIQSYTSGYYGFAENKAGFTFAPSTRITVTALGAGFQSVNNEGNQIVELFDANSNLLATATVSADTMGPYYYTNISPVFLAAGATNFILTYDEDLFTHSGTFLWVGPAAEAPSFPFTVAPEIRYLGSLLGMGSTPLPPEFLLIGPSFQFTVTTLPSQPPSLALALSTSNTVLLSWPAVFTNAALQTSPDLGSVAMTDLLVAPLTVGTNLQVELPRTGAIAFYRLRLQ